MTSEEIERILQAVAQNQSKHDEEFAMLLKSQNRYEERLATISDIMHDLADRQLKNEELFAETDKRFARLADAQMRYEGRLDKMEASYELLEQFVRDFREEVHARQQETDNHFAETDKRMAEFVNETNGRFTETDKRLAALISSQAKTDDQMKRADERMDRTDEQIKALIVAQTRTDEQIRSLLDRNGSNPQPVAKKKPAKKAGKKARRE